jgi:NTE family protein
MYKKGLVLSGGATYGLAHIGLLKRLEEKNIKCDYAIGNSMGSIIAAAYACEMTAAQVEAIATSVKITEIIDNFYYALFLVAFKKLTNKKSNGVFTLRKIDKYLRKIFKDKKIEDCKIKLEIPCVDLETGEVVIKRSGNIVDAILDSICIPGVFDPRVMNVDGMIRVNFPIVRASEVCQSIIGCHLSYLGKVERQVLDNSIINVILRAQEIMGYEQLVSSIDEAQENCAEVIIVNPKVCQFSVVDFGKIKEIIECGYNEAIRHF